MPFAICGNAAGNTTFHKICGWPTPKFFDTFKYIGLTPLTAETVDRRTGKNAAIKIITIAGTSPIPNQSTINGIQAIGEIGLKSCIMGFT